MRILVTGRDGQLGYDVIRIGQRKGFHMFGTGRPELDIIDENAVQRVVAEVRPDAIIHVRHIPQWIKRNRTKSPAEWSM